MVDSLVFAFGVHLQRTKRLWAGELGRLAWSLSVPSTSGFCCETYWGHGRSVRLCYNCSFHSVVHGHGSVSVKDAAADASAGRRLCWSCPYWEGRPLLPPPLAQLVPSTPWRRRSRWSDRWRKPFWRRHDLYSRAQMDDAPSRILLLHGVLSLRRRPSLLELDTAAAGLGCCRLTGSPTKKCAAHVFHGYSWMMVRNPRSPFTPPLPSNNA
jgi:hypothetical protein